MCVLGSREHSCVHKTLRRKKGDINDGCKKLLSEKGCRYQKKAGNLKSLLPEVWDIEEAVQLGTANQGCPYFASHLALPEAQLVFCPYSYLIDPVIRKALNIKLKGAVLILDEAHNIEDVAREAASCKVTAPALQSAQDELVTLSTTTLQGPASENLLRMVAGLSRWLKMVESHLTTTDYEQEHNVWSGEEALAIFEQHANLTKATLPLFEEHLSQLMTEDRSDEEEDEDGENQRLPMLEKGSKLSTASYNLLSSILITANFMLSRDLLHTPDYKMVVLKERSSFTGGSGNNKGRRQSRGSLAPTMVTSLCIWCFNSSVVFSDIQSEAHSIILTSGTLAPLTSFASELGIDFPVRLEAGHVIDVKKQILVGAIANGKSVSLNAQYKYQDGYAYQDALGSTIFSYCRCIPSGILVFFPSYGLLNKVHSRWESTGLLGSLQNIKKVFIEPKGASDMEKVISEYYSTIDECEAILRGNSATCSSSETMTGAIMLAVCRGKASEGIDFSDGYARAVICVGIPYPNVKDLKIVLKKRYQTLRSKTNPHVLDGNHWYGQQAFRALNQAFGRCIRHCNDYGAVILADPRFRNQQQLQSFSKWIRGCIRWYNHAEQSFQDIENFFSAFSTLAESKTLPKGSLGNRVCAKIPNETGAELFINLHSKEKSSCSSKTEDCLRPLNEDITSNNFHKDATETISISNGIDQAITGQEKTLSDSSCVVDCNPLLNDAHMQAEVPYNTPVSALITESSEENLEFDPWAEMDSAELHGCTPLQEDPDTNSIPKFHNEGVQNNTGPFSFASPEPEITSNESNSKIKPSLISNKAVFSPVSKLPTTARNVPGFSTPVQHAQPSTEKYFTPTPRHSIEKGGFKDAIDYEQSCRNRTDQGVIVPPESLTQSFMFLCKVCNSTMLEIFHERSIPKNYDFQQFSFIKHLKSQNIIVREMNRNADEYQDEDPFIFQLNPEDGDVVFHRCCTQLGQDITFSNAHKFLDCSWVAEDELVYQPIHCKACFQRLSQKNNKHFAALRIVATSQQHVQLMNHLWLVNGILETATNSLQMLPSETNKHTNQVEALSKRVSKLVANNTIAAAKPLMSKDEMASKTTQDRRINGIAKSSNKKRLSKTSSLTPSCPRNQVSKKRTAKKEISKHKSCRKAKICDSRRNIDEVSKTALNIIAEEQDDDFM